MSDFRRVTPDIAVSPQITVGDVAAAAAQGFKLIVNNRPEGESPDQTPGAEIEAAAKAAGLAYVAAPVFGRPSQAQVDAVRKAVEAAGGPTLLYCRSGTRSIITWSLGQAEAGARDRDELLRLAAGAGYDLSAAL